MRIELRESHLQAFEDLRDQGIDGPQRMIAGNPLLNID